MNDKTISLQAERDAFKWAYQHLQARMQSLGRHGWAQDCDGEIEARINAVATGEKPAGATYSTTLFAALESAATVICDGHEMDRAKLHQPNVIMLKCDDFFTVTLPDQVIEVDESGTAMAFHEVGSPSSEKTVLTFLVTVPLQEFSLMKAQGVPA